MLVVSGTILASSTSVSYDGSRNHCAKVFD